MEVGLVHYDHFVKGIFIQRQDHRIYLLMHNTLFVNKKIHKDH